jgi:hypothetical protein
VTTELLANKNGGTITISPYAVSPLTGGAPHLSRANNFEFNGGAFGAGLVDRPRKEVIAALSWFHPIAGNNHNFKFGYDWNSVKSTSVFGYPNNQRYFDVSFNPTNGTFVPESRRDYDPPVESTSQGKTQAFYARDKFEIGHRFFSEVGLRYEKQTGTSDIGAGTFNASSLSPRLSLSYDLSNNGKSIILGTYGRFYQFLIQSFSDSFAQNPQRATYNEYAWNATQNQYVFSRRVVGGGSTTQLNPDLKPVNTDEVSLGFQQQFGNTIGVGVRGIYRKWNDLVDDIVFFKPDGSIFTTVENYDAARRDYRGVELTFEKRFSNHWNMNANYTYSKAKGNQFGDPFSTLGDFVDAQCITTTDPTIGTNGRISCAEAQNGSNKYGLAAYDRPHDLKLQTAYTFNLGPVALTAGLAGEYISGIDYTAARSLNVINPVSGATTSNTVTYFYEKRGSHRLPSYQYADGSLEATWRAFRTAEIGVKGEMFNLANMQNKTSVNNTTFCANTAPTATATCTTNRAQFGTATARGSFFGPRSYRITTLVRF